VSFFKHSECLSADVNGAVNPMYKEVHEKDNASYINNGVVLTKFTGHGGKYMANDANAEFVGKIRKIFNDNNVVWQTGELGKVDEGGGGTIAKYIANHNIETIDCGPALISMHSPFEISSKADLFETYKAYKAFFSY
ncbi:MAG: aminopeptidase, partial [Desulfurella sp.]